MKICEQSENSHTYIYIKKTHMSLGMTQIKFQTECVTLFIALCIAGSMFSVSNILICHLNFLHFKWGN